MISKIGAQKYILSIDGGASTTKAGTICLETGKVEQELNINRPLNIQAFSNLSYKEILDNLFSQTQNFNIAHVILGIAGIDTVEEKKSVYEKTKKYIQAFNKNIQLQILNDIDLVLYNSNKEGNKIAIIAGTGSNCSGVNLKGETAKAGGLDYILTDQGSGYWIGKQALEIAVKSLDGRIQSTELSREVLQTLKADSVLDLKKVVYDKSFTKKNFAKLTINVVKCFMQKKDKKAEKILKNASYELFLHVNAVAKNLNINDFTVIEAGSIFKINYVKQCFEREVIKEYDKATFLSPTTPSYYGGLGFLRTQKLINKRT